MKHREAGSVASTNYICNSISNPFMKVSSEFTDLKLNMITVKTHDMRRLYLVVANSCTPVFNKLSNLERSLITSKLYLSKKK